MADTADAAMVKQERRVRASKLSECKVEIKARNHTFYADEPLKAGGTDEGPTPREIALGALAACVTVITGKVAKGLNFNVIDITPNFDHVEVKIRLVTDEPEERIEELKRQHFGRCPISALFRSSSCELVEEWNIERP